LFCSLVFRRTNSILSEHPYDVNNFFYFFSTFFPAVFLSAFWAGFPWQLHSFFMPFR
jgi:hypothetical protein